MVKRKSLRRGLLTGAILAAMIPVLIFAAVSQYSTQSELQANLEAGAQADIENADQCLELLLDKYATVLYDFCTDDELLKIVSEINRNEDILDVNTNLIRRRLSHICNRNSGIEGMTMILKNGQIVFYDRMNSSSTNSTWANEVRIPYVEQGEVFQGISSPVQIDGKDSYLFQIARNLVDYRNIHEKLGTVVLSINENLVAEALRVGADAEVYLLDGSTVISARQNAAIGQNFRNMENSVKNYYNEKVNDTCGFTICVEKNLQSYNWAVYRQIMFFCLVALMTIGIMVFLSFSFNQPYMKAVYNFEEAMSRVEKGDFATYVELPENMPEELVNIGVGFNEMVVHLGELLEKVKAASLEQRNAELSALEAQIDPHFLYNTLDSINWKAIENDQYEISEMLVALAEILRYTVKNAGGTTTLEQEIDWLKKYTMLQSVKLGKVPTLEIKISEDLMGYKIHKLLLQPFVENSIKYGFAGKTDECILKISAKQMENQLHMTVGDNGNGISQEILQLLNDETELMEGHLGVVNVRKRLKLYYGEEATVYYESKEGSYTRVHLFIPLKGEII